MSDGWSKEELRGAVDAYVEMQRKERTGQPFTKKRYYENLATQFGRTEKAFEYRMQNISYVLSLMGRDWLTGLKPAKNVGANVAADIEALLAHLALRTFFTSMFAPAFAYVVRVSRICGRVPDRDSLLGDFESSHWPIWRLVGFPVRIKHMTKRGQ